MEEVTPASTARSMLPDPPTNGDISFDVDHIFQALLLERTVAEDEEASSEGSSSGATTARGDPTDALRGLRRSGPLGEMSGEAFARLLAGTLYEYDNTAPPTPLASPPQRWRPDSRSIPQ